MTDLKNDTKTACLKNITGSFYNLTSVHAVLLSKSGNKVVSSPAVDPSKEGYRLFTLSGLQRDLGETAWETFTVL